MQRSILSVILLFGVIFNTLWAKPPKTVVIKKETANFDLQIKYPQGFAEKGVDTAVQSLIDDIQKADSNTDTDEDLPADLPGKNSLYIDYKTEYKTKNAISLVFMISTYTRGAAHPNNSIKTLNFINGQVVTLDQLFKPNSDYLNKLADISRTILLKKKISDNDWVTKGTEPTQENYQSWHFTQDGLAIVFDTYQVAAYVYGPQTVKISKSKLINWIRPEVAKAVWGNQ